MGGGDGDGVEGTGQAGAEGVGSGLRALMRVSISRVKEVDARVEAVGGDGQGVKGTGQAGAEAAGGDAAGGCPSPVWSVDCLAFANLIYNLRRVQAAISTIMMTMVVVIALGRWILMKLQLLSTEVVFL